MRTVKFCLILLSVFILTCSSKEVIKNNIKVHFKSLANDFAAVDMSLYDNNKFEIKTATLELHGNKEYITELQGNWALVDSNYVLTVEKSTKEQLIDYIFQGWENEGSGFEFLSRNKVSFPVDREFLIINNVMCQKQ